MVHFRYQKKLIFFFEITKFLNLNCYRDEKIKYRKRNQKKRQNLIRH